MNKNIIILLFVILLNVFIVSAEAEEFLKVGQKNNITLSCMDAGSPCNTSYSCNISIVNPVKTIIVENKAMSYGKPFYYEANESQINMAGDYKIIPYCYNDVIADNTQYYMRANYSGSDYLGYNNIGVYILFILIIAGCLYSAFTLKSDHDISKMVLFFAGLINIIGSLIVAYLDVTNADLWGALLTMIIINGLIFMVIFYLVGTKLISDMMAKEEKAKNEL